MAAINASLLNFLNDLEKNNSRDWFEVNKTRYLKEEEGFKTFGNAILEDLEKIDHIEKMKVYRIYKDVRFGKDKTPFKTNRTIVYSREGAALRGSYYLHIQPGNNLIGGGFFAPNPADLLRIRKEFEMDASEIREVLADKEFSEVFGNQFAPHNQVKTAPKGFSKDHPANDLIKNKSFFFEHKYTNEEIQSADFSKTVVEHYKLLRPYLNLMSDVLTTDLNGESVL